MPDGGSEWFYCPDCAREFGDPHAEDRDGMVVGQCACGFVATKEG